MWWIGWVLGGCGNPVPTDTTDTDPTDTDSCSAPLQCTVGTGEQTFHPLAPGGDLQLVHGPQGGWHLNAALYAENTSQVLQILPLLTDPLTGTVLAGGDGLADTYNQALILDGECSGESAGIRAIFDGADLAHICSLQGQPLELRLEIRSQSSEEAACSAQGVVVLDPIDVHPCAALATGSTE